MNRIAVIGIIVEEPQEVEKLNQLLHEYGSYIIGRMGIPYRERKIHVISIAMDAPQDTINALTGKIGRLEGMACPGGCVAGAGTLQVVKKAAAALEKMKGEASFTESSDSKYQSRLESLEKFDVE